MIAHFRHVINTYSSRGQITSDARRMTVFRSRIAYCAKLLDASFYPPGMDSFKKERIFFGNVILEYQADNPGMDIHMFQNQFL